jgi:hypothetical protein
MKTIQDLLDRMDAEATVESLSIFQAMTFASPLSKFDYEIKEYTVGDKVKYEGTVFQVKAYGRAYTRTFYGDTLDEVKEKIKTYVSVFAVRDKIVESGNAKDLL